MPRTASGITAAVVLVLLAARAVEAQTLLTSSLSGRVVDDSGQPLPGVTVEIESSPDAKPILSTTDAKGAYAIAAVPPCACRLSFRLPNFAAVVKDGITVKAGQSTRVDTVLRLSVTAAVTVTGKATFRNLADIPNPEESLIGVADAASEGAVTAAQIDARPTYRTGEILETVPGVVISQHSGEGKANQYYLRGFNLDHGTDFASTVAGIPVNMPSNAHGQGYSDLNFLIPELVSGVQYRKGPYDSRDGDFATAGAADIDYANSLDHGIARGADGADRYGRFLVAQSPKVGDGTLLYAFEASHNNGPWVNPDNYQKYNGVLRYSLGDSQNGFSLTAMGYHGQWNSTDQVPDRAIESGLIPRFGAIDPTDGGASQRYSLSAEWQQGDETSLTHAIAYAVDYRLNLYSDFTYFLDDPVNGDQFEQADRRIVTGAKIDHEWRPEWFGRDVENMAGVQLRNDNIPELGLFHTRAQEVLSVTSLDHVSEMAAAAFFQSSIEWSQKVKTVLGLREDFVQFNVRSNIAVNSGNTDASIFSPKLSVILGPWAKTEFYANFGDGYHSNDARGTTITVDPSTRDAVDRVTPLVRATGAEIGLRSVLLPHVQTTVALWGLDIGSELVFTGDAGTTEPSRPSRRDGIEWTNYWSPSSALTIDADLSLSRARYRDFDVVGDHVPGAIEAVASAGVAIEGESPLFGSLRVRYFGPRPLIEDNSVRSPSSSILNGQIGYRLMDGLRATIDVFNIFNERASDVDYYYVSRLPGEPEAGVADIHTHPLEPRTVRASIRIGF